MHRIAPAMPTVHRRGIRRGAEINVRYVMTVTTLKFVQRHLQRLYFIYGFVVSNPLV